MPVLPIAIAFENLEIILILARDDIQYPEKNVEVFLQ